MKRKELVEKSAVLPLLSLLLLSVAAPLLSPFLSPPVPLAYAAPTEEEHVSAALNQRCVLGARRTRAAP